MFTAGMTSRRVSSSAFQWEGAVDEDEGRLASGIHTFTLEDVRLMYDMGLDAFRLSISWPRLIPSGRGPVNSKALRFYKNLIYELKRHGNSSTEPYIALHNMLLAHASTARLYNQKYKDKQNGYVGITCFAFGLVPLTSSEEDEIAAQRANEFFLGWVLHPLVFGDYPNVMKRIAGERLPSFSIEESNLVKDSSDFFGVIHYTTMSIAHLSSSRHGDFISDLNAWLTPYGNSTLVKFDVLPWGLEGVLEYIKHNYGNSPVYILENGMGLIQVATSNGRWWICSSLSMSITHGLYYVNFSDPERKRSPKTSALWYSAFLKGTTVSSQDPCTNISLVFFFSWFLFSVKQNLTRFGFPSR